MRPRGGALAKTARSLHSDGTDGGGGRYQTTARACTNE